MTVVLCIALLLLVVDGPRGRGIAIGIAHYLTITALASLALLSSGWRP